MRRRGVGTPQTSTRDTMAPNRNESNSFHPVLITSLIWAVILILSVFATSRYSSSSSTKCSQTGLVQKAFCGIGHVFIGFCSDSDQNGEDMGDIHQSKIQRTKSAKKISTKPVTKIQFKDIYDDGVCDRDQGCEDNYVISDESLMMNQNPSDWPGEMGSAYLPPEDLLEESKARFAENMFDIAVSDRIALNRAMPDIRNQNCKAHSEFNHDLPNTSIIIVFHNEGNSTLLRTLVSIVNRTPWRLIHEIILLDDASVDREYLHEPLQRFIETLPVRTILLRNDKRLGLISSRVKAAKIATGETLMFLDSHVEVLNGWLFYLLEEIQKDRKSIVCPIIDVLTWDAFQLLHGATDIFGTFSWKMIFRWSKIEGTTIIDQSAPIRTPTMAGGLYAIDRLYFEELGMYDEGIKIWGGENLEMSFKCWMCGGRILIHPCSHVAHVFRKETPYKFLEHESIFVTIFKNYKRVALVWLDEYKELIYAVNPDIKRLDGGDVSSRLELRAKLNCSSFRTYLDMFKLKNFPFDHRFIGSISTNGRRCLDSMTGPDISKGLNTKVSAQACHTEGGNQIFLYTKSNRIHFDELCLEPNSDKTSNQDIILAMCVEDRIEQKWEYDQQTSQLKHQSYKGQCLQVSGSSDVVLAQCDINIPSQKWSFNKEVQLHN
ncbi:hypothetical protein I4U23_017415 [Adineta vaga]|nr:hypothetical protein I4U23_017415 [Adineta vaga]